MSSRSIKPKCWVFFFFFIVVAVFFFNPVFVCLLVFVEERERKLWLIPTDHHFQDKQTMLQKRIKIGQADYCLARIEKCLRMLTLPPDFSSCHFSVTC